MPEVLYYRLLDPKHENMIVKAEGSIQQRYEPQKGWIRTGIMLEYFWPDSDAYNMYAEISEEEALKEIASM